MLPVHNDTKGPMKMKPWRSSVFDFLTRRSKSIWSKIFAFYIEALVVVSIILLCLSSFPKVVAWPHWGKLYFGAETFITANFLVDFLLKAFCSPRMSYLRSLTSLVDFLSVLPWFFDLLVDMLNKDTGVKPSGIGVLRAARFARFFHMAVQEFPQMTIFLLAVQRSKIALLFLGVYVVGAGLLSALIVFFAETSDCVIKQGAWTMKEDSATLCRFQNIGDAAWFVIVTMTTVGYGDLSPVTTIGKIVTSFLMIISVVSFALPVAIFGANLTEVYVEQNCTLNNKQSSKPLDNDEVVNIKEKLLMIQQELDSLLKASPYFR